MQNQLMTLESINYDSKATLQKSLRKFESLVEKIESEEDFEFWKSVFLPN